MSPWSGGRKFELLNLSSRFLLVSVFSCQFNMYIKPIHAELDVPTLHAFIKQNPLGLFTIAIPNEKHSTIQTTHIPFVLDAPDEVSETSLGVLRGHIGRANPQSKIMIEQLESRKAAASSSHAYLSSWLSSSLSSSAPTDAQELTDEVFILFNAPVHSYIPPKFYVETKGPAGNGPVAPTWNFAAVQVYGRAKIYHERTDASGVYLQKMLEDLTRQSEAAAGHENPWEVADAPVGYVETLKKAIIGVEITITKIEGRFKLSQEAKDRDWAGVVKGLKALGTPQAGKMAEMIEERGKDRGLDLT